MLSIQHVLCGALAYETEQDFKDHLGALVLPDAIRAYTGNRQLSHFEQSPDCQDVSWLQYPSDMKSMQGMTVQGYLVPNIPPCVLGERSDLKAFHDHNQHLDKTMYDGIEMHLRQDIAFDNYLRDEVDCNGKYVDCFMRDNVEMDGKELREWIGRMEQQGFYLLAQQLYEKKGITANQAWLEQEVKPVLEEQYPQDLADKTFSFMKIDPKYDTYITNHDWSHTYEGPCNPNIYREFYDNLLAQLQETPSSHESVRNCSDRFLDLSSYEDKFADMVEATHGFGPSL